LPVAAGVFNFERMVNQCLKRNDKKQSAKALSENAELRAKYAKLKLDNQIAKLFIEEELDLEAIAKRLGISDRRAAITLDELVND
jgi:hypothetical protein